MQPTPLDRDDRPILAWTLGDVAGIGPEIAVKAWPDPDIHAECRPVLVGDPKTLSRQAALLSIDLEVKIFDVDSLSQAVHAASPKTLVCIDPSSTDVSGLVPARVHAEAGRAAFEYLVAAIDWAKDRRVDAIVTLPLHKEGLRAAGIDHPGHTEILAERTGVREYGMMLYRRGLAVLHVTLHCSLRDALDAITTNAILEKIVLLDRMIRRLGVERPRLAVAALNPHAGDGGLFGDEERRIIRPAVDRAADMGVRVDGPIPVDTLFVRAVQSEFDGVVAMYHDQGHIALKLLGWREAVNITVGLPIIRTSVAHGTAYDIVGRGVADPTSLKEAVRAAVLLARRNPSP